jgi:predicted Zn-dependent protease
MQEHPTARRTFQSLCGLLAVLAAVGCQPPAGGGGGEGPGHRSQALGLSPEQEYELGVQAYREILSKSHVVRSGPQVEQVRRVGERIAKAATIKPLQREINLHLPGYRFNWEFNVLDDPQVNAFCLPGGKVGVYTGLLRLTADNDDLLAVPLSHEVAHALAHHANERVTREQLHRQAAERGVGGMDPRQRGILMGILTGARQFQTLAFDRRQEAEADHIGIFLMTFAGYDPRAAVVFWERMMQAAQGHVRPPEILSTHPSDTRRLAQIRTWVPQALAGKKAYDEGRIAPER